MFKRFSEKKDMHTALAYTSHDKQHATISNLITRQECEGLSTPAICQSNMS